MNYKDKGFDLSGLLRFYRNCDGQRKIKTEKRRRVGEKKRNSACHDGKRGRDVKIFHRKTSEFRLRRYRGGRVRQGERGAAV